jgi:uncharacterized metal-binding protein YceD (DUF177 family)
MDPAVIPEFSRRIPVGEVPARGADYQIEAGPEERAALARRFGLQDIARLSAKLRLQPIGGGPLLRLTGTLAAEVTQTCGVSLAPVPAWVEADLEMTFGPAGEEEDDDEEEEIDLDFHGDDPPDPFVDGAVDLGEAVAEHLSLALDPFPRAPDAVYDPPETAAAPVEEKANPFAVLAGLRKNDG